MPATAQTPWRSAPLDRRAVKRTAELADRVFEQARARPASAVDAVRRLMIKVR
jgi:hypothetical protein